jgi:hypothetical protein
MQKAIGIEHYCSEDGNFIHFHNQYEPVASKLMEEAVSSGATWNNKRNGFEFSSRFQLSKFHAKSCDILEELQLKTKLAKFIVNLSGFEHGDSILEPFVGNGEFNTLLRAYAPSATHFGYGVDSDVYESANSNGSIVDVKSFKEAYRGGLYFDRVITVIPKVELENTNCIQQMYSVLNDNGVLVVNMGFDADYKTTTRFKDLKTWLLPMAYHTYSIPSVFTGTNRNGKSLVLQIRKCDNNGRG